MADEHHLCNRPIPKYLYLDLLLIKNQFKINSKKEADKSKSRLFFWNFSSIGQKDNRVGRK
jgi:hypothetical protein